MIAIVDDLIKFLENISELRVGVLELQSSNREDLGYCSAHIMACIDFAAILASTIEATTQDKFRSHQEFEKYSEIHQDIAYCSISDLRELTNSLIIDFRIFFSAHNYELSNLNMLEFPNMIMFNLKEIQHCLQRIK